MKERIDLTKYLINKDNPNGKGRNDYSSCWYAGGQLEALRFYLDKKVKILAEYMEDDYQGECFAILDFEGTIVIWRDSFGSCSGCDGLEDEDGYDYIKLTLQEGNTRQFDSIDEAKEYVNITEDYWWKEFPKYLFEDAINEPKAGCLEGEE